MKNQMKFIAGYGLFALIRILFQLSQDSLRPVYYQTYVVVLTYLVFGLIFLLLNTGRSLVWAGPVLMAGIILEKLYIGKQTVVLLLLLYLFLSVQNSVLKENQKRNISEQLFVAWMLFLVAIPIYMVIQLYQTDPVDFNTVAISFKTNVSYFIYFILLLAGYGCVMVSRPSEKRVKTGTEKASQNLNQTVFRQKEAYFLAILSIVETAVFVALQGNYFLTIPFFDLWSLSLILLAVRGDLLSNAAVERVKRSVQRFLREEKGAEKKKA